MVKVKPRLNEVSPELDKLVNPESGKAPRKSIGNDKYIKEIYFLSLDNLIPFRGQARKKFKEEELEELKKSILEVGIRQPLSVMRSKVEDKFEIVSGERRFIAAQRAGLERVPCLILEENEEPNKIALIENLHREDLHPVELGAALEKALEGKGHGDISSLAEKVGMYRAKVSEYLRLNKLPDNIKEILLDKNLTNRATFRKLLVAKTEEEQMNILFPKKEKHKKKIGEVYMEGGSNFIVNIKSEKLTSEQRSSLRKKLESFILEL